MSVVGISQNEKSIELTCLRLASHSLKCLCTSSHMVYTRNSSKQVQRGNSSLTLPSWNEFVVTTETPWRIVYCSLLTTRSVSGIVAATVEGQGQGQVCCRFSQGCQELLALEKVA